MYHRSSMIEGLEKRYLMANAHFVGGPPDFSDQGLSLNCTGSIAGLGNGDVTITLNATGTATIVGVNPAGKAAPGQTRPIDLSGEQTITDVKNGRVDFNVSTEPATAPADALPNKKWTAVITDVNFQTATLIVEQGGQTVLTASQTF